MASYKELLAQKAALEAQIQAARKSEISGAIQKAREIISEFDLTVDDIFGARTKKAQTAKVAPKYKNPETGETWTGRGKPPKWIAGKEDRTIFLIAE